MSWAARRSPRVSPYNYDPLVSWYRGSCYNALGNADCRRCCESVVTTQIPQAMPCVPTLSPHCCHHVSVSSLHSIRWPQDLHITLSTVEWKEGLSLNIGYSRAATYAFFTNLARWKFLYENRLIEISQESCENIIYEWYPIHMITYNRLFEECHNFWGLYGMVE